MELTATPFFPQEDYQCGPAALATVLDDSGLDVTAEELVPKVWLPQRRGSLQPELLAASREYGRIPYVIAPDFSALLAEVAAGHPVLVLQNLGVGPWSQWHYAVVVGYSRAAGQVVLRSGEERRRVTPARVFARTWARGDNWGMIALPPGTLPADGDAGRYLKATAAMEATGHLHEATAAYGAALTRWPDSSLAYLGLGNARWALGERDAALDAYRQAAALDPADPVILNNLASALATLGHCGEAAATLDGAAGGAPVAGPLQSALADTRREVADCREPPE